MKSTIEETKPLPSLNTGTPLVNETDPVVAESNEYESSTEREEPELASEHDQMLRRIADLEEALANSNKTVATQNAKLAEIRNQKSNFSDISRKFRLFQSILQGFAARGLFDPAELKKNAGIENSYMRHAAGLAEVAQNATLNRF